MSRVESLNKVYLPTRENLYYTCYSRLPNLQGNTKCRDHGRTVTVVAVGLAFGVQEDGEPGQHRDHSRAGFRADLEDGGGVR